jgi:hypothetical protein
MRVMRMSFAPPRKKQPVEPATAPEPDFDQDEPLDDAEPDAFDEADELAEMSDADFVAMLERAKAEFQPPPIADPAPWDRPPQPRKKRYSRPRCSVNFLHSNQLRLR